MSAQQQTPVQAWGNRRGARLCATVRDHVSPSSPRHGPVAQLLLACSPLSVILLAYALAHWVSAPLETGDGAGANRLGFGLHVEEPAAVDRAVFGGVPSVWMQQHLVDGSSHWYDAAAALVYVTHYVAIPAVTALVWFGMRNRFRPWIAAVLAFTGIGVAGYVVYPAAPPWLASQRGQIGGVDRISTLGWEHLQLPLVGDLTSASQAGSNPIAAMPSLHAGAAMLVTLFLWPLARTAWRVALVGYVVLMALALVYTGEHYVVDVVAGWLTAAAAVAVAPAVIRRRAGTLGAHGRSAGLPRRSAGHHGVARGGQPRQHVGCGQQENAQGEQEPRGHVPGAPAPGQRLLGGDDPGHHRHPRQAHHTQGEQ